MTQPKIMIRLIGLNKIDLQDTDYLRWRGVSLHKVGVWLELLNTEHIDLILEIDGMRPTLNAEAGTETLGIADIAVASRSFSFTTKEFFNKKESDMWAEIHLNKWFLMPYKFFTLWQVSATNPNQYLISHTELGINIINPPLAPIGDLDTPLTYNEVACVPVKVQSIGSVEHQFTENPYRKYTIDLQSSRTFKSGEIYEFE